MNQSTDASGGAPDTFDHSCDHWSAAGQDGMEAFYRFASVDYEHLAAAHDWARAIESLGRQREAIRLADIACGSGKFPATLLRRPEIRQLPNPVQYDLLDPSRFSIEAALAELRVPFVGGNTYECTAQDWSVDPQAYAVMWATHALYCVPETDLAVVASNMAAGLAPGGVGLVAQSSRAGHYVHFYDLFCEALAPDRTRYSDIEQVATALRHAGLFVTTSLIDYETQIPIDEVAVLERYLQRCAFDDSVSLEQMRASQPLGGYLIDCTQDGTMTFKQQVGLLLFAHRRDDLAEAGLLERCDG